MKQNTVVYIGADGPLRKACRQIFEWKGDPKVIVVIRHEGWVGSTHYWRRLAKVIQCVEKKRITARALITFFGSSVDEMLGRDGGDRLPLIFRLLGRDTASRDGCCRITDLKRLGKTPIPFDPNDPETALILQSNKIMGLCFNESTKA
ncbi:MAG: hypothetical protein IH623_10225 [Verrucomicrobia bacterium]|nr:hypothetical protein [Verrucomicrobiota bacterium]